MPDGRLHEVRYQLPLNRVFEYLVPRLVDLGGDGRDAVVLVESDLLQGAALVVVGLRPLKPLSKVDKADAVEPIESVEPVELVGLARSPFAGSSFFWLNPLGFALVAMGRRRAVAAHV